MICRCKNAQRSQKHKLRSSNLTAIDRQIGAPERSGYYGRGRDRKAVFPSAEVAVPATAVPAESQRLCLCFVLALTDMSARVNKRPWRRQAQTRSQRKQPPAAPWEILLNVRAPSVRLRGKMEKEGKQVGGRCAGRCKVIPRDGGEEKTSGKQSSSLFTDRRERERKNGIINAHFFNRACFFSFYCFDCSVCKSCCFQLRRGPLLPACCHGCFLLCLHSNTVQTLFDKDKQK